MRDEANAGPTERIAAVLAGYSPRRFRKRPGERWAAVLVPVLIDLGGAPVLLERRADRLLNHAGQYAFPGGAVERGDGSAEAAALREAQEEVGLEPGQVEILGRLSDLRTPTGFLITPVVGVVHGRVRFRPHQDEVAEVVLVPLEVILGGDAFRPVRRRSRHVLVHSTALVWQGREIWGATARILLEFRRVLSGAGGCRHFFG